MPSFFISDEPDEQTNYGVEITIVAHIILFENYLTFWSDSHCQPLRDLK